MLLLITLGAKRLTQCFHMVGKKADPHSCDHPAAALLLMLGRNEDQSLADQMGKFKGIFFLLGLSTPAPFVHFYKRKPAPLRSAQFIPLAL